MSGATDCGRGCVEAGAMRAAIACANGPDSKWLLQMAWGRYLLRTMRNPDNAPADRFAAARVAAPFCHPVLQAVRII